MKEDNPEGFVEDYEKTAKKQLDILTQHIKSKNIVNHENLTKIVSAPTLHMQKSIIRPESDKRLLDQAFDELEQFITTGNHEVVDIKNPALRDILFDMKAKHTFNKQFEVVDATRQFDSNFYRVEYRNCHVRQVDIWTDLSPQSVVFPDEIAMCAKWTASDEGRGFK